MSKYTSYRARPSPPLPPLDYHSTIELMKQARHITFSDFHIYAPNHAGDSTELEDLTSEQIEKLWQLYPGTESVSIMEPFFNILVTELPPKPWPITVAGMPLHITTDIRDFGFEHHFRSCRVAPGVLTDVTFGSRDTCTILTQAIEAIRERGVNMVRLEFWGRFLMGVLEEDPESVKHLLPARIAGKMAQYRQKDQACDSSDTNGNKSLRRCVGREKVGSLIMKRMEHPYVIDGIVMALVVTRVVVDEPEESEQCQYVYKSLIFWQGLWD